MSGQRTAGNKRVPKWMSKAMKFKEEAFLAQFPPKKYKVPFRKRVMLAQAILGLFRGHTSAAFYYIHVSVEDVHKLQGLDNRWSIVGNHLVKPDEIRCSMLCNMEELLPVPGLDEIVENW